MTENRKLYVGRNVWTPDLGQCVVVDLNDDEVPNFPILLRNEEGEEMVYTADGKYYEEATSSSIFLEPPTMLLAEF